MGPIGSSPVFVILQLLSLCVQHTYAYAIHPTCQNYLGVDMTDNIKEAMDDARLMAQAAHDRILDLNLLTTQDANAAWNRQALFQNAGDQDRQDIQSKFRPLHALNSRPKMIMMMGLFIRDICETWTNRCIIPRLILIST